MAKFRDLSSRFSKTNVKPESSAFEIGYMQNFVKIRNLTLFGQKTQIWGFGLETFKNKWQF